MQRKEQLTELMFACTLDGTSCGFSYINYEMTQQPLTCGVGATIMCGHVDSAVRVMHSIPVFMLSL